MREAIVSLLAAASVALATASGVAAQPAVSASKAGYISAASALLAKMGDIRSQARAPSGLDPVAVRYRAEANALRLALGTPAVPVESMETFDTLCEPTRDILNGYLATGLALQAHAGLTEALVAQITQQVTQRNAVAYLDDLLPALLFSIRCSSAHMPAAEAFVKAMPPTSFTEERREGVREMQRGAFDQVRGMLITASDPVLGDARLTAIVDELDHDAPGFAIILRIDQRRQLATQIEALKHGLKPQYGPRLDRVAKALEAEPCGLLCST